MEISGSGKALVDNRLCFRRPRAKANNAATFEFQCDSEFVDY